MLKIKLARFGKKNQPHFRIIVNEARSRRDGEYMAQLGSYAPAETPKLLEIDMKEYNEWLKKGAQPTDTVASLAKRFESVTPFPKKKAQISRKAKAKLVAAKAEAAKPKEEAVAKEEVAPEVTEKIKEEVAAPVEAVEVKAEAVAKEEVTAPAEDSKTETK